MSLKEWACCIEGFVEFHCGGGDPDMEPVDPEELAQHKAWVEAHKKKDLGL